MVMVLNARPDLRVWHEANLDEEFSARSEVETFAGYLALEERLFAQLQTEVYDKVDPGAFPYVGPAVFGRNSVRT